jgi:hypothetical protein
MKKHQSMENLTKTFTCWVSVSCSLPNAILPPGITTKHLEEFFKVKSKEEIGEFHSLKLVPSEKYKNHQCFINFLSEKCANKAVTYFNKISIADNIKLEAKYRPNEKISDQNNNPLLQSNLKLKDNGNSDAESLKNVQKKPLLNAGKNDAKASANQNGDR